MAVPNYRNFDIQTTPQGFGEGGFVPFLGLMQMIAAAAGKNQLQGGYQRDPRTGQVQWTPYAPQKGFLGALFNSRAQLLNAQQGSQAMEQQFEMQKRQAELGAEKEMQTQRLGSAKDLQAALFQHEIAKAKLENENKIAYAKADADFLAGLYKNNAFTDIAKAARMSPEQYATSVMPQVVQNAKQYETMKGQAMQSDEAQQAVNKNFISQEQAQDWANRQKGMQQVTPGGTSNFPGELGKGPGTTVKGASQVPMINPQTGQPYLNMMGLPVLTMGQGEVNYPNPNPTITAPPVSVNPNATTPEQNPQYLQYIQQLLNGPSATGTGMPTMPSLQQPSFTGNEFRQFTPENNQPAVAPKPANQLQTTPPNLQLPPSQQGQAQQVTPASFPNSFTGGTSFGIPDIFSGMFDTRINQAKGFFGSKMDEANTLLGIGKNLANSPFAAPFGQLTGGVTQPIGYQAPDYTRVLEIMKLLSSPAGQITGGVTSPISYQAPSWAQ